LNRAHGRKIAPRCRRAGLAALPSTTLSDAEPFDFAHGREPAEGRKETHDYNNRLQAVRIQLGTSATANANNCLVYNYYSGIANPTSCTVPSQATSGNDGTVVGQFFQDTTTSLARVHSIVYV